MRHLSYIWILSFLTLVGSSAAPARYAQDQITEVTLERTRCYGRCPSYQVVLRSDGAVTYIGKAYVARLGTHRGTVDKYYFDRLAELLRSQGYFELKDNYSHSVSDQATVITSVVVGERRKTVRNYADAGPIKLWGIEMAIEALVAQVKWEK